MKIEAREWIVEENDIEVEDSAAAALKRAGESAWLFAMKHNRGDWGEATEQEKLWNEHQLDCGFFDNIVSVFRTSLGERIYVSSSWRYGQPGVCLLYCPQDED